MTGRPTYSTADSPNGDKLYVPSGPWSWRRRWSATAGSKPYRAHRKRAARCDPSSNRGMRRLSSRLRDRGARAGTRALPHETGALWRQRVGRANEAANSSRWRSHLGRFNSRLSLAGCSLSGRRHRPGHHHIVSDSHLYREEYWPSHSSPHVARPSEGVSVPIASRIQPTRQIFGSILSDDGLIREGTGQHRWRLKPAQD